MKWSTSPWRGTFLSNWHASNAKMFIIQCPILWYAKVCALPSAHSSCFIVSSVSLNRTVQDQFMRGELFKLQTHGLIQSDSHTYSQRHGRNLLIHFNPSSLTSRYIPSTDSQTYNSLKEHAQCPRTQTECAMTDAALGWAEALLFLSTDSSCGHRATTTGPRARGPGRDTRGTNPSRDQPRPVQETTACEWML